MEQHPPETQARFVVITGLSGSGKSSALKALEDIGFYAVDNLPVELLPAFIRLPLKHLGDGFKAALGLDIRSPKFVEAFPPLYTQMNLQGYDLELIFLEASDESLLRRFSQTRRLPPLARPGEPLEQALDRERLMLEPVRSLAHQIIDTSRFTIHELKQEISYLFHGEAQPAGMQLNLLSFGYKHGLPHEADLVIDVRFLDNPYFVDHLRDLDGRDPQVVDYIFQKKIAHNFLIRFKDLLDFLLPQYRQEGKSQITVALGCTGGRHRSVAVAQWLAQHLETSGMRLSLRHRDIDLR